MGQIFVPFLSMQHTPSPIIATPTTLVIGFLGAGKTTFINQLIAQKNPDDTWALLINEFGKIGIDGSLIDGNNLAIKEVSGGCICCTSQLPLQVALVRLLSDHRPSQLIIEPTGLSHPDELSSQLSQSHWQNSLSINAIICVLNLAQWQQEKYRTHEGYIAHIKHADIIVYHGTTDDTSLLHQWVANINPKAMLFDQKQLSHQDYIKMLSTPRQTHHTVHKVSLAPPNPVANPIDTADNVTPPYRYHDILGEYQVGGWLLPVDWQFISYPLQKWLLNLPDYLRIKAVIHTDDGWVSLNITPESINISDASPQDASKLELILSTHQNDIIWQQWDDELMALCQTKAP